ncbi:probable BOI-related E3 ubiquitin-protein ligase 3 [Aegilops tauschii subsp. strangulata]|uniref:RING-type domain-containing protein n=1 Tax=Aegilops tauschii subsp. strangulata TaxID=200361 RepID=A0A453H0I4_AEGTS|nr:probable BOI-related E3 ubiquitin-protein ligase 3 [Aegilops tauschii subsp. strangulata]
MAVDLQRLRHMLLANRPGASAAAMPASGPCYGAAVTGQQLGCQPYADIFTPPPTMSAADQYSELLALAAADLARKGDGAQEMTSGNKRRRVDEGASSAVLGEVLAAHAQQQAVAVDHILHRHARKMWAALAEQRRSHLRLIVSTVEARAAKRLKAKDEEIERVRGMNWALEERLRSLYMEAQMWRDVAQSHEAAASVLRADLQRVLDAQAVRGGAGGDGDGQDDAESCCWGENQVPVCAEEEAEVGTPATTGVGRCKGCGEGAAVVLLLPCRHLCVCAPCAASAQACPSCGCAKNGSVCVNFS